MLRMLTILVLLFTYWTNRALANENASVRLDIYSRDVLGVKAIETDLMVRNNRKKGIGVFSNGMLKHDEIILSFPMDYSISFSEVLAAFEREFPSQAEMLKLNPQSGHSSLLLVSAFSWFILRSKLLFATFLRMKTISICNHHHCFNESIITTDQPAFSLDRRILNGLEAELKSSRYELLEYKESLEINLTKAEWLRLNAVILSRLHRCHYSEFQEESCLLPVLDLINTGSESQVNTVCVTVDRRSICRVLSTTLNIGEEIIVRYGDQKHDSFLGSKQSFFSHGLVISSTGKVCGALNVLCFERALLYQYYEGFFYAALVFHWTTLF